METEKLHPPEAIQGRPDEKRMRQARKKMDELREQIRRESGIQEISVKLIRESRGYTDDE